MGYHIGIQDGTTGDHDMCGKDRFRDGIYTGTYRHCAEAKYGMKWPLLVRCVLPMNRQQIEAEKWDCKLVNESRERMDFGSLSNAILHDICRSKSKGRFATAFVVLTDFFLTSDGYKPLVSGVIMHISVDANASELLEFDPSETGRYGLWKSLDVFVENTFRDEIARHICTREADKIEANQGATE